MTRHKMLHRLLVTVLALMLAVSMMPTTVFAMNIFIRVTWDVHSHMTIEVEPTDRIGEIKQLIYKKMGIPVDQQILIFAGKTLEDDNTLQDYSIQKDSNILLDRVSSIGYFDENGQEQTLAEKYTVINNENTLATWESGWYVVDGDVTIDSRVAVNGDVKLILKDGANLIVNGGIHVSKDNRLTVYAQSTAGRMGRLTATSQSTLEGKAGIGGGWDEDGGMITINGGTVTATGGANAAGIGGGQSGNGGSITINGGTVTAIGGDNGAGIGGYAGDGCTFTTGTNGNAVIFASSISDQSGKNNWRGLIFEGNEGNIYGDHYTVDETLIIPANKTLTVEEGKTLTVNSGATLINQGSIQINLGGAYVGAQPEGNLVTYYIGWDVDGDGNVDDNTYVAYQEIASHGDGSKEPTADTTYTFIGWNPAPAEVTAPAIYTAQFSSGGRNYTVTLPKNPVGYSVSTDDSTSVNDNGTFTFTVEMAQGYYKTSGFAVKANGKILTASQDGSYTVQVKTNIQITVEGVAKESALAPPTVDTNGYGSEWTADHVILTPFSTADSGIAYYEYSTDGGKNWTKLAENSLTVSKSDFATDYIFRATSNAGGVSAWSKPVTVRIDKEKLDVTLTGNTGDYLQEDTLKIGPLIALSGISKVEIQRDGGAWETLDPSDSDQEVYFYSIVKNGVYTVRVTSGTQVVSEEKSITYANIDRVVPDGDITFEESSVKKLIHQITFGLFFNKDIDVEITATDEGGEVDTIEFYQSDQVLTEAEVRAITDWTETDGRFSVTAKDQARFIYYVKITDKAGNVACFGSDGATFDLTAPVITGITDGATYYTTQRSTVFDINLQSVTVNGSLAGETFDLKGNTDGQYTIVATDQAGNKTECTVTMKPIDSLSDSIEGITIDNVTSGDKAAIEKVKTVAESVDLTAATAEEKSELKELLDHCESLITRLEESAQAGNTENIEKVEDMTADNVKPEDQDDLTAAKEDLENALKNFGENYTEEERAMLEDKLDRIKSALESLSGNLLDYRIIEGNGSKWMVGNSSSITITANGPVEKFVGIEVDGKAVDAANYTVKSGSTIITLKPEYLNTLSVGKHALTVVYTDGEAFGEFEILKKAESTIPGTGDSSNVALWMILMFGSVCVLAGTRIYSRKRNMSNK